MPLSLALMSARIFWTSGVCADSECRQGHDADQHTRE